MRVTTITCDRCKQEITDLSQIWPIVVSYGTSRSEAFKAEWCRSCTIEMGILKNLKEETVKPRVEPPPTLEDLIREIAYETACEAIASNGR